MPHIGGDLTNVRTTYQTQYGLVSTNWSTKQSKLQLDVSIPANTTATVYLPAATADGVTENSIRLSDAKGIKVTGKEGKYVVMEIGSGNYSFAAAMQ